MHLYSGHWYLGNQCGNYSRRNYSSAGTLWKGFAMLNGKGNRRCINLRCNRGLDVTGKLKCLDQFGRFSRLVVSDTFQLYEPQYTRPPCPSPTAGVHPNPCPSSRWCHPTISSLSSPSPPALNLSSIRIFSNDSTLRIRWPQYWSLCFTISPSNEYSGLISLRMGWFGLICCPRDSQESPPTPQCKSINSLALSFLYSPTLTSIHD